ncbi:MAG: spermidine synthase [bacterium]|nr:spermidine synthase [bacterium]
MSPSASPVLDTEPPAPPTTPMTARLAGGAAALAVFAPAIFLGAFLIFQVQPMISKHILPWFGGTPAVWTTCVLVFQALLFAGYCYAHLTTRWLGPRAQSLLHLGLVAVAAWMTVLPGAGWKPTGSEQPMPAIVVMLLASAGLPYFVLAATGPLLQAWFFRVCPKRSPYPLYALSNAGSLIALVSYPFLVEPALALREQSAIWSGAFVAYGLFCLGCTIALWRTRAPEAAKSASDSAETADAPTWLWMAWAACGVVLFMSVTNQISLSIASFPFMWVLPLSVYLLTFILAFSSGRWYSRRVYVALLVPALAAIWFVMRGEVHFGSGPRLGIVQQIALYAGGLFLMCMICHAELYRLRPRAGRLTSFYLAISFGGALGGIVVGVAAPMAFLLYQELQLGILGCCVLLVVTTLRGAGDGKSRSFVVAGLLGIVLLTGLFAQQSVSLLRDTIHTARNFYGLLRVQEVGEGTPGGHLRKLYDGAIVHGMQFVHPDLRRVPVGYYTPRTGLGGAWATLERDGGRNIAVVGLGVGTLAALGRPEDRLVFYEINPEVVHVAENYFTYLDDCLSETELVLGDARLQLEREADRGFDLLILDAFSSDAIPVHLLTREAFELYERHLAPHGTVAVNISNHHLDVAPLVYGLAHANEFYAVEVDTPARLDEATLTTKWMILSRDADYLNALVDYFAPMLAAGEVGMQRRQPGEYEAVRLWTDDYSNLFQILR